MKKSSLRSTGRIATGLFVVVALSSSLAGCVASSPEDTSTGWATVDPTEVTGTVTHWEWGDSQDGADAKVEAFNKVYPNVKVTIKAFTYGDYATALSAALASGSGPDTYDLEPGAMANQFGPLSEDVTPLFESVLGDDWKSKISSSAVAEMTVDGRVVGAPNAATGAGTLMVNQGLLDDLGLEFPSDISSVDELVDFCAEVNKAGTGCLSIGAKDEWVSQDVFQAIANSVSPGAYLSAVQGKGSWEDPALVKAFDIWSSLFTNGVFQDGALAAAQYPDAMKAWYTNAAIATPVGTWGATDFVADLNVANQQGAGITGDPEPMRTVIAPFPGIGGSPVNVFSSVGSGTAINSSSPNKEAAAVWVNWWSLDKTGAQKISADSLVGVPAITGVTADIKGLAYPDLVAPSLSFITDSMAASVEPRAIPYPELVTALGNAMQQSATGVASADVAAQLQAASAAIAR